MLCMLLVCSVKRSKGLESIVRAALMDSAEKTSKFDGFNTLACADFVGYYFNFQTQFQQT